MYETKVRRRKVLRQRLRVDMHFRKGKFSCLAPGLNDTLNLWCPQEIGALGSFGSFIILRWHIHVVASTAMLRAIAAASIVSLSPRTKPFPVKMICLHETSGGLPLGKALITTNVPSFARFAAFSTLCMASTRGTSSWACHR